MLLKPRQGFPTAVKFFPQTAQDIVSQAQNQVRQSSYRTETWE